MFAEEHEPQIAAPVDLVFGPLHYRFQAEDAWGTTKLRALTDYLCASASVGAPGRMVRVGRGCRPDVAEDWTCSASSLGTVHYQAESPLACWTASASPDLPPFRYELPWALIVADTAELGGAVVHAGFALHRGKGLLFVAPPGGGKSTTLASAPEQWTVLSDDAALLWPAMAGWLASPLPSWTMMTASEPQQKRFNPGHVRSVDGVIVLEKGSTVDSSRLAPVAAATHLYHALSEYPSTVHVGLELKEHFFRTACKLARTLPCWQLTLPLGGDIWPLLVDLAGECP